MSPALTHDLWGAALAGAMSVTVLALSGLLRVATDLPREVTRKFAHVGSGVVVLLLPVLIESSWVVLGLSAGFAALMVGTHLRGSMGSVHAVGRGVGGVLWYPLASWLCFVLAFDVLHAGYISYAIAVLVLATADAAGALVGKRWGMHRYQVAAGHWRSVEGSLAVAAMTFVCVAVPLAAGRADGVDSLLVALIVAVTVAAVEAVSRWGTDNVTVPIVALVTVHALRSATPPLLVWATVAAVVSAALLAAIAVSDTPRAERAPAQ